MGRLLLTLITLVELELHFSLCSIFFFFFKLQLLDFCGSQFHVDVLGTYKDILEYIHKNFVFLILLIHLLTHLIGQEITDLAKGKY